MDWSKQVSASIGVSEAVSTRSEMHKIHHYTDLVTKESRPFVIALSNRDIDHNDGGIETCIRREVSIAQAKGMNYALLIPGKSAQQPCSSKPYEIKLLIYSVDPGSPIEKTILSTSTHLLLDEYSPRLVIIHSLIGHSLYMARFLLLSSRRIGIKTRVFIHDFHFACGSYHLIRNYPEGSEFCNVASAGYSICEGCKFANDRPAHVRLFLAIVNIADSVLCPSSYMRESLTSIASLSSISLARAPKLLPHYSLGQDESIRKSSEIRIEVPKIFTVAFYGAPVKHKGWVQYMEIASRFKTLAHLRFICFSSEDPKARCVDWIRYSSRSGDDHETLLNHCNAHLISIFFFWSLIPESYGLSFHEACATGLPIFCNNNSQTGCMNSDEEFHNIRQFDSTDKVCNILKSREACQVAYRQLKQRVRPLSMSAIGMSDS